MVLDASKWSEKEVVVARQIGAGLGRFEVAAAIEVVVDAEGGPVAGSGQTWHEALQCAVVHRRRRLIRVIKREGYKGCNEKYNYEWNQHIHRRQPYAAASRHPCERTRTGTSVGIGL